MHESLHHGWPSFRDAEVISDRVRVLSDGETVRCVGVGSTSQACFLAHAPQNVAALAVGASAAARLVPQRFQFSCPQTRLRV